MTQQTRTDATEIDIRGLGKVFGSGANAFTALHSIDLSIRTGEFFTLLGPSGCGKTTLLRLIAGFEAPTQGSLKINGEEVAGKGPNVRPVNTVFQNYALFPHMTVADNIGFGLKMQGRPRSEVKATVAEMLALVRMEAMADRKPSEISGGQQQRVALARALAPRPRVLLLDEPLSALDLKLRKEMQSELKRLQTETGITFIFVTHDQEEALTMSDRIAVMSAGQILQLGAPSEIYHRPAVRFVADFIGETNFMDLPVQASTGARATLTLPGGTAVEAELPEGLAPQIGATVTTVLRPEQAMLAQEGVGHMSGTLEDVVFFGTDTHLHLRLDNDQPFTLRRQNSAQGTDPELGARLPITLAPGALRILRE